jgi:hypothetical protein
MVTQKRGAPHRDIRGKSLGKKSVSDFWFDESRAAEAGQIGSRLLLQALQDHHSVDDVFANTVSPKWDSRR